MRVYAEPSVIYRVARNGRSAIVYHRSSLRGYAYQSRWETIRFAGDLLDGAERYSSAGLAEAAADNWVDGGQPDQPQLASKEVGH